MKTLKDDISNVTNGTVSKEKNSYQDNVELKTVVPDGGWGWVVCCSCLFGNMTMGGIFMSYGILLPNLKENFRQGTVIISFIGSVMTSLAFGIGPLVAILTNRFGLRTVFMTGSVLSSLALLASTFSTNSYVLLLTYGVCGGLGLALIMLPTNIGCNYYFDKKRALATGISKTGVTIGGFIFPPLIDLLLESYNWKVVVYVYSGIAFISCFFGAMIRPLELIAVRKKGDDENENGIDTSKHTKTYDKILSLRNSKKDHYGENEIVSPDSDNSKKKKIPNTNSEWQDPTHFDQISQRRSSIVQMHEYIKENQQGPTELIFAPKQRRGSKVFLPALAKSNTFYDGSINDENNYTVPEAKENQSSTLENQTPMQRRYSTVNLEIFDEKPKEKHHSKKITEYFDLTFWKNPAMICLLLSRFFGNISMSTFYMYLPSILLEKDISMAQASIMLTVVNIVNTIFRVSFGALMDHPKINCLLLNGLTFILGGVAVCVFPFINNYSILMVLGGINGAMIATYPVCLSVALGQMLETDKLASVAGKLSVGMGLGSLVGPVFGGYIFDYTQNVKMISFYNASAYFLTSLFACMSALLHRRSLKHTYSDK